MKTSVTNPAHPRSNPGPRELLPRHSSRMRGAPAHWHKGRIFDRPRRRKRNRLGSELFSLTWVQDIHWETNYRKPSYPDSNGGRMTLRDSMPSAVIGKVLGYSSTGRTVASLRGNCRTAERKACRRLLHERRWPFSVPAARDHPAPVELFLGFPEQCLRPFSFSEALFPSSEML